MWFMLSTFTTVGYGDVGPESSLGKALSIVLMAFCVLIFSMMLATMGHAFNVTWDDRVKVIAIEELRAKLFTGDTASNVRSVFDALDTDESSSINFSELGVGLRHLGIRMPPKMLAKVWSALDPDGNGEIEFEDFMSVMVDRKGKVLTTVDDLYEDADEDDDDDDDDDDDNDNEEAEYDDRDVEGTAVGGGGGQPKASKSKMKKMTRKTSTEYMDTVEDARTMTRKDLSRTFSIHSERAHRAMDRIDLVLDGLLKKSGKKVPQPTYAKNQTNPRRGAVVDVINDRNLDRKAGLAGKAQRQSTVDN